MAGCRLDSAAVRSGVPTRPSRRSTRHPGQSPSSATAPVSCGAGVPHPVAVQFGLAGPERGRRALQRRRHVVLAGHGRREAPESPRCTGRSSRRDPPNGGLRRSDGAPRRLPRGFGARPAGRAPSSTAHAARAAVGSVPFAPRPRDGDSPVRRDRRPPVRIRRPPRSPDSDGRGGHGAASVRSGADRRARRKPSLAIQNRSRSGRPGGDDGPLPRVAATRCSPGSRSSSHSRTSASSRPPARSEPGRPPTSWGIDSSASTVAAPETSDASDDGSARRSRGPSTPSPASCRRRSPVRADRPRRQDAVEARARPEARHSPAERSASALGFPQSGPRSAPSATAARSSSSHPSRSPVGGLPGTPRVGEGRRGDDRVRTARLPSDGRPRSRPVGGEPLRRPCPRGPPSRPTRRRAGPRRGPHSGRGTRRARRRGRSRPRRRRGRRRLPRRPATRRA